MATLKHTKKFWIDNRFKYIIFRRTLCTFTGAPKSSKALVALISRELGKKKLERILKTSHRNNIEETNTKQFHESVTNVGSIVAARYFSKNIDKYTDNFPDVIEQIKSKSDLELKEAEKVQKQVPPLPIYPLRKVTVVEKVEETDKELQIIDEKIKQLSNTKGEISKPVDRNKYISPDRGFFVYRNNFVDEYTEGSDLMLPQERPFSLIMTKQVRRQLIMSIRRRYGPVDAVEEIEFQLPRQKPFKYNFTAFDDGRWKDDWTIRYGVADPTVKPADKNCQACGAQFQCQNSGLPGFLPVEYFLERQEVDFRQTLCRRCYLLKTHNFLVNVNVSTVNYEHMLGHLRHTHEALIILIVDMLDFPCSIYKTLPDLIGHGKHVIVVGNKIDLIPPDSVEDYLKHYKMCLRQTIESMGFGDKLNIMKTFLISAKTGYNIEELVTYIQVNWRSKGDIYLIGCTNSGKSTLFNAFLQSDLCKVRAVDLVERATTSVWPGTTLSLLKFPVMNPAPHKLLIRQRRLAMMKRELDEQERHRRHLLESTGESQYAVLQGHIGHTFEVKTKDDKEDRNMPTSTLFMVVEKEKKKSYIDLNHQIFTWGKWCYDTPGTINHDQITNLLSLEELVKTVPGELLLPRTVLLRRRQTLFIAGLARVDFIGPTTQVFLTVFASAHLPLNVVELQDAGKFYSKYFGTAVLGVPCGGEERLKDFPHLESEFIELEGIGMNESVADIVLSSVGWVAVTNTMERRARFNVWTPERRGIHVRFPAMLPFAVCSKGKRIRGTNEYEVNPLFPSKKQTVSQFM